MTCPYLSPAVLVAYGEDADTTPQLPAAETAAEAPPVEPTPETPPPPTVEELQARILELQARPTAEAVTEERASLLKAIEEGGTKFSELQTKHGKMIADRAIADAANEAGVFSTAIFTALLGPKASVDESGAVTIDVDGVQMSPAETVAKMKEVRDFWSLFKSNIAAGIGGHSGADMGAPGSGGPVNLARLTSEEYRRLRRESPHLLGLSRKPQGGAR